jgi:ferric-dicitrate binding protein FerR (iron transport regulator)
MAARGTPRDTRVFVGVLLVVALFTGFLITRWFVTKGKHDSLAVLIAKTGRAERDSGASVGTWRTAEPTSEFFVGDGVRTGKESTALLALSDKSSLRLESNTLIRFLERPSDPKHQRLDVQMGEAVLEAGSDPVSLETDIGVAVLTPGSKMSLTKTEQETRYEVVVGLARFESKDGEKTEVSAGQSVVIGIGAAKLERYVPAPSASASPVAPPASASATAPVVLEGVDIVVEVTGPGAVVRAPGAAAFTRLAPGQGHLPSGSTLKLSAGSSATVARGGQRVTLRGLGEFVVGAEGKPFIATQGGGVSLTGAATELEIAVPGGSIVTRLGARGDVGVGRDVTRVSVTEGKVELRGASGVEQLGAGEEGTIGNKGAEVKGRGPDYVDLMVAPGTSFAVHDPRPPTAIGFTTAALCPEGATVQFGAGPRTHSRTTASVSAIVNPGTHRYAIRCVGRPDKEVAASGSIALLADSGTARIPRTAPATFVDTDGRSYTVLYQNLLPKITVRWPGAPTAASYTLHIASPGGKTESLATTSPSRSFPSGALREGEHRASFEGGGTRSKETRIDIKFDNAAPTATLLTPANGGFQPGSAVTVSGVALEGWKISAGGRAFPLDDQLRFSGEAVAPTGQRALAIEFVHPHRGLHYYLRRAASP